MTARLTIVKMRVRLMDSTDAEAGAYRCGKSRSIGPGGADRGPFHRPPSRSHRRSDGSIEEADMYWYHHGFGGGMVAMMFTGLVLTAGLVALILLAIRTAGPNVHVAGGAGQPHRTDEAARILAERYARGEIDDEEYRRRRQTLSSP
jgi:putative membrane protein